VNFTDKEERTRVVHPDMFKFFYGYGIPPQSFLMFARIKYTVEPVITHTPRWMVGAMGYYRLWVLMGMLKIDSKKSRKDQ
jgi:hypothetical protein